MYTTVLQLHSSNITTDIYNLLGFDYLIIYLCSLVQKYITKTPTIENSILALELYHKEIVRLIFHNFLRGNISGSHITCAGYSVWC